ncbi:MAG: hypothetical protein ACREIT_11325 [Tepidisphaeraceae bacterium]
MTTSRRDYLPDKDAALLAWAQNFSRLINQTPAAFGITQEIAAEYGARLSDFANRLQAATDPATRGRRTVFLKDEARKILVALTRKVARQIGNTMSVTNDQRQELGITVPSQQRKSVPVPGTSPFIQVKSVDGRTVTIELRQSRSKRGRPGKVAGATVFTHAGESAPEAGDEWKFATNTTKTTVQIPFGPSATGDTVWITAFWSNARDESGPAAKAVSVNLPAGGVLPSEANEAPIRRAA